jgi:arylsulfatase A-like enzyme
MSQKRPNVLWICTDQQRYDTLGCYGTPYVRTPNLDRLAERGVLFEHAYCQSPICTPSRASFLTGRYPRTTRCRQNGQAIPPGEVLVTRILADAGYTCGLSGKLHLSPCHPSAAPTGERRIDDGYAEFHWSHTPLPSRVLPVQVTVDGHAEWHLPESPQYTWPTNEYQLWLREQGAEYTRIPFRESGDVQVSVAEKHHQTTWCMRKAITFIEANRAYDRPWLFSVNTFDPHHPFDPPEAYLQPYLDRLDDIPLPNYAPGELADKPPFQRIDHRHAYNNRRLYAPDRMSDQDHRLIRAAYWAMVDLIDAQVGGLIDALEATGQLEDTIVLFTSDHGELLGDHGLYLKGPFFYEPAIRVPLIVAGPGIRAGVRSRGLVELTDLAPSLLDAAGLPRHPGMQGRSLWPMLTGQTGLDDHRDDVYCEYYNALTSHKDPTGQATMVRTDAHKLVAAHGLDTGELYDLVEDPSETLNRWDDPAYRDVKLAMFQRLCDRMAWTVDPLPPREGPW